MSGAPILARRKIRLAALAALEGAALGAMIDSPGDLTSQPEKLPAILLRASRSSKEPLAAASLDYTTVVVLEFESRVSGLAGRAAQDALEAFDAAIEQALLTNHAFTSLTQRIYVDTEPPEITSAGRIHFAGTKWLLRCELIEVFDPIYDAPASLQPIAVPFEGMDLHADLIGTFDPTGAYPGGPFASSVTPAPRTSGPDGRDEGALTITLPQ